jgi:DNA-binding NarL/FixJ family response regulator
MKYPDLPSSGPKHASGPQTNPPMNVLIVEDDPVFSRQLGQASATVVPDARIQACETASAALEWIEAPGFVPGLALVDLGLPDLSGIEVIREIHRRHPDAPILVISVISAERSVLAAIRAGARGYLLKDGSTNTLITGIRQVLAGEYPISPSLARYLFRLAGAPSGQPDGPRISLSPKEAEVLQRIARGLSYAEAAAEMGIALSTVQSHVRNLYRKLDAHSQVQAVKLASEKGLL